MNPKDDTVLCKLRYDDGEAFQAQGGVFSTTLLDTMLHPGFVYMEKKQNLFAGGIEAAHFLRKPTSKELYVLLMAEKDRITVGNRITIGDLALYDDEGRLCSYWQKYFTLEQAVEQDYQLLTMHLQPMEVPPFELDVAGVQSSVWGPEHNH